MKGDPSEVGVDENSAAHLALCIPGRLEVGPGSQRLMSDPDAVRGPHHPLVVERCRRSVGEKASFADLSVPVLRKSTVVEGLPQLASIALSKGQVGDALLVGGCLADGMNDLGRVGGV